MECPKCQHQNPAKAKFCMECGTKLIKVCPKCGAELPLEAKFCMECGTNIGEENADDIKNMLRVDAMGLDIGNKLISLVGEGEEEGVLLQRIRIIRRELAKDLGFIVPPIRIKDNWDLPLDGYSILIRDNIVASGKLMVNHYLAMEVGPVTEKVEGIATQEPTNKMPSLWITEEDKERAQVAGYLVVDAVTVLATHLIETIKKHSHELLTRQDTHDLLDILRESQPALVEELVPDVLPLSTIQKVLQNLLKEGVPIRDMVTILETLADNASEKANPIYLTEYVRWALARSICKTYVSDDGTLSVIGLDEEIENSMANAIGGGLKEMPLDPNFTKQLISAVKDTITQTSDMAARPVILCSASIRPYLKRLLELSLSSSVTVLSYDEIAPDANTKWIERVSLS